MTKHYYSTLPALMGLKEDIGFVWRPLMWFFVALYWDAIDLLEQSWKSVKAII